MEGAVAGARLIRISAGLGEQLFIEIASYFRPSIFNTTPLHSPVVAPSHRSAKCRPLLLPPPLARPRSMPQRLRWRPRSTRPPLLALHCTRDSLSLVPSAAQSPTALSHPSMCMFPHPSMALTRANGSVAPPYATAQAESYLENDDRAPS